MPDSASDHVHSEYSQVLVDNELVDSEPSTSASLHKSLSCGCDRYNVGRNLVVCIDGTSNKFGRKNTNVTELYNRILKKSSDGQRTYYNSGVGTFPTPRQKLSWTYTRNRCLRFIDLAIAINFDKIVMAAYRWLSENYKEHDRIYLFGFSRGAYQVRIIAAMIAKVGLLHKGNDEQIPFAYEIYLDPKSSDIRKPGVSTADTFKNAFSQDVRVHFVGVWDTVSSVGIVRGRGFPKVNNVDNICFFRHALALDETRVKFLPEFVHGGQGPTDTDEKSLHVKEVWFPGTHSDVGGGNIDNPTLDLGGRSLQWMSYESISAGLKLNIDHVVWNWEISESDKMMKQSMSKWWKPFELLPIKRLSYENKVKTTRFPHFTAGRRIMPNQKIHFSIAFCKPQGKKYIPRATSRDTMKNGSGEGEGKEKGKWIEFSRLLGSNRRDSKKQIDFFSSLAGIGERNTIKWAMRTPIFELDVDIDRLEMLAGTDLGIETLLTMDTAITFISHYLQSEIFEDQLRTLQIIEKVLSRAATTSLLFARLLLQNIYLHDQINRLMDDPAQSASHRVTPFFAATFLDQDYKLEKILKEDNLDLKSIGVAALLLATECKSSKAIQTLLKHGVDINARGGGGPAPPALHRAVRAGHVELVKLLLENNAKVDRKDLEGQTPIAYTLKDQNMVIETEKHIETKEESIEKKKSHETKKKILDLLLEKGADKNTQDNHGTNPLYSAAAGGHLEDVKLFLDCGTDPSIETRFGWAPLHWAAGNGHTNIVKLLLERGANPSPLSDTGKTPRNMAHKNNHKAIVKLLTKAERDKKLEINHSSF